MASKEGNNKKLLDIIQGISQALSKKYDGALDDENNPIQHGLKRDVEKFSDYINLSRSLDGFNARIQGTLLIVSYHSQINLNQAHDKNLESDIEDIFANIIKFLKKQYKIYTKQSLKLTPEGKVKIKVETSSLVRSWLIAQKIYKISGYDIDEEGKNKDLDNAIKKWIEQKSNKKPKNVKISKKDNEKDEN